MEAPKWIDAKFIRDLKAVHNIDWKKELKTIIETEVKQPISDDQFNRMIHIY